MSSPAAANGPTNMIFGMGMDIDDRMPIFGKSGSKVKVKKVQKKQVFAATFSDRWQVLVHSRPERVR